MRVKSGLLGAALLGLTVVISHVSAQGQAPAPPPAGGGVQAPAAPARQGGEGRGRGQVPPPPGRGRIATFPAGQRPPGDPAIVARGKALYEANCRLCHGADLRGGEGGPNLLRATVQLHDENGDLLIPFMRAGVPPSMPPSTLAQDELHAVAIYLHEIARTMSGQGGPPRGNPLPPPEQVLVGNVDAGRQYFAAKCASCHSATGDMAGIGTRVTDPRMLQNSWVSGTPPGGGRGGRGGGGRGGAGGGGTTVTVTLPNGQKFEGTPGRLDEFVVVVRMADGSERSFPRNGDVPKVEVKDPRQPHRDMLPELLDTDMHNVTAFLASLK